jgi:acyl-CoA synthetase (AMP-forming)/AMP-acid ligase II
MDRTTALGVLAVIFEQNSSNRLLVLHDGQTMTYGDFWQKSDSLARRLAEIGLQPGSKLLIQLENSENLLALYLACAIGGYVACPVDPTLPKQQLARLQAMLKPAVIVTDGMLPSLLQTPRSSRMPIAPDAGDQDYLLIFSSGSTGQPKVIVHSLRTIVDSASSFCNLSGMNQESVVYHHFPMFYMAGIFNMFFCPLMVGGTIAMGPRFSKQQMLHFWELPIRHEVNCLSLTPTMAHSLCQLYRRDDRVLAHLSKYQAVVSTGSTLYRSIAERFYATFHTPLRSCYGITEVGGTITFQSWEDALAFHSTGAWASSTNIRAGVEGSPKEILVKTPFMARGYLVRGELVRPYDAEGFFHSGDLGYVKDGLLFFAGRDHELVKKGGEFVSTQLIEDLALRNPLVSDVAAVGVSDEFWGAKLVLFYVPQPNATEPEILPEFERLFVDGLREIERPDKIIPVPWMPKTSIGKIVKQELVEKYSVATM